MNNDINGRFTCVHGKLDWYTMMFDDTDFITVLKWLGLGDYVDEFVSNFVARANGYEDQFVFGFNGISVSTKQFGFFGADDACEDWFYKKFPKVRLDITGSGLDFLRSGGLDVDVYLRSVDKLPCSIEKCRLTRCDFAFDFVNFEADFVDKLIAYTRENSTPNNRLCVYGRSSGLCYEVKTGGQKTVYVGSKNSEQMLRVYDKKLQYYDLTAGCYKKENPYHDPDSWIRIELQTRKLKACELCFGKGDFVSILRYIHDQFNFVDYKNTTAQNRRPASFWSDLFPWDQITELVKNKNFAQPRVSARDQLETALERVIVTLMLAYSEFGPSYIEDMSNAYLKKLNLKQSLSDVRRLNRLLSRIVSLSFNPIQASYGLISDGTMLRFKL